MNDKYFVKTRTKPIDGKKVVLPGSKSITNRALILSAMSRGKTTLSNFLISDDSVYLYQALNDLGIRVRLNEALKNCTVEGVPFVQGDKELFIGNAGTAMRFLTSYLCLGKGRFRIDGDERMRQRPIGDLLDTLRQLGGNASAEYENDCPPVIIEADGLKGGECKISGKKSSQYISSILMAAPLTREGVVLKTVDEVSSKPYIDMTAQMMRWFGGMVERKGFDSFKVPAGEYISPMEYPIEPDASGASYFMAATAVLGGECEIKGLGKSSVQGDVRFADALEKMGCEVSWEDQSIILRSDGKLKGIDIDMNAIPDMAPTLAVVALFADTPTVIRNVANLRIKESDRLAAMSAELSKYGAEVIEYEDGLEVRPSDKYTGAEIETYNDHRIAMANAIAGLKIKGVVIKNPGCVAKTFPKYFDILEDFVS